MIFNFGETVEVFFFVIGYALAFVSCDKPVPTQRRVVTNPVSAFYMTLR